MPLLLSYKNVWRFEKPQNQISDERLIFVDRKYWGSVETRHLLVSRK